MRLKNIMKRLCTLAEVGETRFPPCSMRRRRSISPLRLACFCITAAWFPLFYTVVISDGPMLGGEDSLRDRILEAIEDEMLRTMSPHSKIAALEDKHLPRYADEMDLVQRLPRHLFEASAAVCRAVCRQGCGDSSFHRSALCRCSGAFDALTNLSVSDPASWGEIVVIDIDQKGKMMEVCSGLMTCLREPSAGCTAKAEAILLTSTAGSEAGGSPSHFRDQVKRIGSKSVRQLFDYVSTLTYGEHSASILESILETALSELPSQSGEKQHDAIGHFVDLGCGRGKMLAGAFCVMYLQGEVQM
jgi:hypothetical protein